MPAEWVTVPNFITFARLALVPVFIALQLSGRSSLALFVFAGAMASDLVDGLLARLLDQRSKLGGILDPIADKLLVFAGLVSLVPSGRVPAWLVALVAFRDGLMALGALWVRRRRLEVPTAPTRVGKYATFALTGLVVLALASLSTDSPSLRAYAAVVGFVAALCVAVSTVQYFARFGYLLSAPRRSSPSAGRREERPSRRR